MFRFFLFTILLYLISCHIEKKSSDEVAKISSKSINKDSELLTQKDENGDIMYPKLIIEKTKWDLQIRKGERLKHRVIFINKGKTPLLIKNVSSTCTCTAADFTKKYIHKDQTGSIDIEFDSADKMPFKIYKELLVIEANTEFKYEKLVLNIKILPK